jgi:hypothetical protein
MLGHEATFINSWKPKWKELGSLENGSNIVIHKNNQFVMEQTQGYKLMLNHLCE